MLDVTLKSNFLCARVNNLEPDLNREIQLGRECVWLVLFLRTGVTVLVSGWVGVVA